MLEYVHDPAYRRTIHHMVSRGERRNSLARDVFHGQRGQLRKHYQVGQTALEHLAANGYPLDPDDVARLTPSATPRSTSMAGTGPPGDHPPPDSGRYEPIY